MADNKVSDTNRVRVYVVSAILLVIPFIAYVLLPTYDRVSPELFGVSFFYWYQTLWLAISAAMFGTAAYMLNNLGGDNA